MARPEKSEAAPYYFSYIDRVDSDDVLGVLEAQAKEMPAAFRRMSEEGSRRRYAEGKWSAREVLSHVSDTERVFVFRAFWFARGFDTALPSFDQEAAITTAGADGIPWSRHVEDFEAVRRATLTLFRGLPAEAWTRRGVASGNPVTVRALAYITAGHAAHHAAILAERYGMR